ncbi:hypothetical protein C0J52_11272 [Blattella germanica]|nr:hypothetical protein C0J52_11272 [Blattella germanica]
MQFGAEHSPAPCDGHAEEAAAKIDGETKLGIELPKGADHRNILLHKIGSYLALVMKALAKTVEPSEVLDGSSTHLDFHVDAELKEPESHLTITENHPNEVVLHTLWTGDGCQNVHVDHPHQSQGSVGPQLLVSSVPAEARTNGGMSVSNISPLNSFLGALARVGTPGNNPGGLNSQNIAVPLNPLVLQAILSRLQNANNNPTGNANLPPLVGIITEDEVEPEEGVANAQPNQRQSVENILRNILSSNRQILPGSVDPSGLLQNPLQAFIMASPSSLGGNISPFSQDNPQLRNALLSPSDLSQILGNISQNPNVQFIPTGAAFGNGMNEPLSGALRSLLRNQVAQNVNGLNLPLTGNSDPSSALNALENEII